MHRPSNAAGLSPAARSTRSHVKLGGARCRSRAAPRQARRPAHEAPQLPATLHRPRCAAAGPVGCARDNRRRADGWRRIRRLRIRRCAAMGRAVPRTNRGFRHMRFLSSGAPAALALVLLVGQAAAVSAQDSREAEIAAAQAEKAKTLEPYQVFHSRALGQAAARTRSISQPDGIYPVFRQRLQRRRLHARRRLPAATTATTRTGTSRVCTRSRATS